MIRREGLTTTITCDGCGKVMHDRPAKWRSHQAVWKDAQSVGWTAKKMTTASDYNHFCPSCSK
jgi:hypothetical protein